MGFLVRLGTENGNIEHGNIENMELHFKIWNCIAKIWNDIPKKWNEIEWSVENIKSM